MRLKSLPKVSKKSTQKGVNIPRDPASLAKFAGKAMSENGWAP